VIVDTACAGFPGTGELAAAGLLVRPAEAGDRAALEAMFQRCTPQTVYRRFHGQVRAFPATYLAEVLAAVPSHFALVACSGTQVVALASCRLEEGDAGEAARGAGVAGAAWEAAELGILIEDGWQRRGLGRELLDRLVAYADSMGVPVLNAQMLTEQDWLITLLTPYGECTSAFRFGVREVRLRRNPSAGRLWARGVRT
jgi:GNAT superfamily N-acetyltransferase